MNGPHKMGFSGGKAWSYALVCVAIVSVSLAFPIRAHAMSNGISNFGGNSFSELIQNVWKWSNNQGGDNEDAGNGGGGNNDLSEGDHKGNDDHDVVEDCGELKHRIQSWNGEDRSNDDDKELEAKCHNLGLLPEPSSMLLGVTGALVVAGMLRRRLAMRAV